MADIKLKPNDEQRDDIEYWKHLLNTQSVHGADQKTIYWVLSWARQVSRLFQVEKLLKVKGLVSQEYEVFKSKKYANVSQNARKVPREMATNGFSGDPIEKKGVD